MFSLKVNFGVPSAFTVFSSYCVRATVFSVSSAVSA